MVDYEYDDVDAASVALSVAEADVAADLGQAAVDAAWSDIVRAVARACTPAVASELLRRNGLSDDPLDVWN